MAYLPVSEHWPYLPASAECVAIYLKAGRPDEVALADFSIEGKFNTDSVRDYCFLLKYLATDSIDIVCYLSNKNDFKWKIIPFHLGKKLNWGKYIYSSGSSDHSLESLLMEKKIKYHPSGSQEAIIVKMNDDALYYFYFIQGILQKPIIIDSAGP